MNGTPNRYFLSWISASTPSSWPSFTGSGQYCFAAWISSKPMGPGGRDPTLLCGAPCSAGLRKRRGRLPGCSAKHICAALTQEEAHPVGRYAPTCVHHADRLGAEGLAGDPAGRSGESPRAGITAWGRHHPRRGSAEAVNRAGQGTEDGERKKYPVSM